MNYNEMLTRDKMRCIWGKYHRNISNSDIDFKIDSQIFSTANIWNSLDKSKAYFGEGSKNF